MKIATLAFQLQFLLRGISSAQIGDATSLQLESGVGDIVNELGPLLSEEAVISLPSSPRWTELLVRAAAPRIHPGFVAVVEVATEKDVQHTVIFPYVVPCRELVAEINLGCVCKPS